MALAATRECPVYLLADSKPRELEAVHFRLQRAGISAAFVFFLINHKPEGGWVGGRKERNRKPEGGWVAGGRGSWEREPTRGAKTLNPELLFSFGRR